MMLGTTNIKNSNQEFTGTRSLYSL